MKIKATQDAWYKKKKIREGQIVDYNEPEVPCWGTLADGDVFVEEKGVNEDDEPVEPDSDADESDGEGSDEDDELDDGDEEDESDEQGEGDSQLEKDLELIRDLAVENDVWVEIPDNCTAKEEIELIKQGLSAKGIKLNF